MGRSEFLYKGSICLRPPFSELAGRVLSIHIAIEALLRRSLKKNTTKTKTLTRHFGTLSGYSRTSVTRLLMSQSTTTSDRSTRSSMGVKDSLRSCVNWRTMRIVLTIKGTLRHLIMPVKCYLMPFFDSICRRSSMALFWTDFTFLARKI